MMPPCDDAKKPPNGNHQENTSDSGNQVEPSAWCNQSRPFSRRKLISIVCTAIVFEGFNVYLFIFRIITTKRETTSLSFAGPFTDLKTIRISPIESKIVSPNFLRLATTGGHACVQLGFMFKGTNNRAPRMLVEVDLLDLGGSRISRGSILCNDMRPMIGFIHLFGHKIYRTGMNTENIPMGDVDIASVGAIHVHFSEHP